MQVLDGQRLIGTVRVPPRKDCGQEKCGMPPTQCASPDGGSDPTALEPTDESIRRQCFCNPVWNGLTRGIGVAGRYDRLPHQYVPLLAEPSDRKI